LDKAFQVCLNDNSQEYIAKVFSRNTELIAYIFGKGNPLAVLNSRRCPVGHALTNPTAPHASHLLYA